MRVRVGVRACVCVCVCVCVSMCTRRRLKEIVRMEGVWGSCMQNSMARHVRGCSQCGRTSETWTL